KEKLRHSLGQPSRSDFVQSLFTGFVNITAYTIFWGLSMPAGFPFLSVLPPAVMDMAYSCIKYWHHAIGQPGWQAHPQRFFIHSIIRPQIP
ncbi:hypothetical protein, partial [Parablautia intestinalis]|uniref:hypothetical protein n=1 Tax=Parablautia intestinalis TaxID=2320100 RepID=UPI00256EA37A